MHARACMRSSSLAALAALRRRGGREGRDPRALRTEKSVGGCARWRVRKQGGPRHGGTAAERRAAEACVRVWWEASRRGGEQRAATGGVVDRGRRRRWRTSPMITRCKHSQYITSYLDRGAAGGSVRWDAPRPTISGEGHMGSGGGGGGHGHAGRQRDSGAWGIEGNWKRTRTPVDANARGARAQVTLTARNSIFVMAVTWRGR